MKRILIPLAGVACLGLIIIAMLLGSSGGSGRPALAVATDQGCDQAAAINAALTGRGFTPDQYRIGGIDWNAPEANNRSQGAFAQQTPRSAAELVGWLNNGSAESNAAADGIASQSGLSRSQLGITKNWLPVQFTAPIVLPGNTGYSSGQLVSAGERQSAAGDVIWFYVAHRDCSSVVVTVRAGCGNPQGELPKPVNPTPKPSPGPTPTSPPTNPCGNLCKGPDTDPAPCVDNQGVRCDGIPGSGGQPGSGGAISHGDDGYSPSDPPPPPVVTTVPPPTSVVTLPPTSLPPTPGSTIPPPPG